MAYPPHCGPQSSQPILIIKQDPRRCTVGIIELAIVERPEKGGKTSQPQAESDWDEETDTVHRAILLSRNALATTISDEIDIAKAAISGVTKPKIASGTARKL